MNQQIESLEEEDLSPEQECIGLRRCCYVCPYLPDFRYLCSRINYQQAHLGDKGYTMSSPSSVAEKSGYTGMPEIKQKHTPAD